MASKTTRVKGKKAAAPVSETYQKAAAALEKALRALYKGDVQRAKEQLERIRDNFSSETELMDRVRSYLRVCEARIAPQKLSLIHI